jgi:DNA topoisomerase I
MVAGLPGNPTALPMPRLRRSDCSTPGIRRVPRGRGFSYVDADGEPVRDDEARERIDALAIPPAWRDVWICPDPLGHLQATGIDAAGRKQYRYHDLWRAARDRAKFDDMLEFARGLPLMRRRVSRHLRADGLGRERVLACAVRMLDDGLFRIGSEEYADDNGSFGLATIRKDHVTLRDGTVVFDYPAKSGQRRVLTIGDEPVRVVITALKRRRGGSAELLAYKEGGRWRDVKSTHVNDYLKDVAGPTASAKDFRTWGGTVLAAVVLARRADSSGGRNARKRTIAATVKEVAEYLGNTPAVARKSYIDPRVFDRYLSGWTIELEGKRTRAAVEAAVLDLLEVSPRQAARSAPARATAA